MTSLYMGLLRFSEARYSSHEMAPGLVLLRPSNEHILIVRVPGARDQHGCHSVPPACADLQVGSRLSPLVGGSPF